MRHSMGRTYGPTAHDTRHGLYLDPEQHSGVLSNRVSKLDTRITAVSLLNLSQSRYNVCVRRTRVIIRFGTHSGLPELPGGLQQAPLPVETTTGRGALSVIQATRRLPGLGNQLARPYKPLPGPSSSSYPRRRSMKWSLKPTGTSLLPAPSAC